VPVGSAATTAALVVGASPCRLWELDAHERLRRQLAQVGIRRLAEAPAGLGDAQQVLVIDAGFLFELLTLRGLLAHPGALLVHPASGRVAAASAERAGLDAVIACVRDGADRPAGMRLLSPAELAGYDRNLRKTSPPLLEAVTPDRRAELEALLYGNAYKGITDFVTKWWWPRPARAVVGWCARFGITPNMVTLLGFLLVLAATFAFYHGAFALGLACGWIMTLLDTVDGKLARVSVASSRVGHVLDHGIDIVHPPFWYVAWGLGLGMAQVAGMQVELLCWLVGGQSRAPDRGCVPPVWRLRNMPRGGRSTPGSAGHRAAQSMPRHPDARYRGRPRRPRLHRRGRLDAREQRHCVPASALRRRRALALGATARFLVEGRRTRRTRASARVAHVFRHARR
jgi:hypothetical protein